MSTLDHLWQDTRLSARGLARNPGFTAAVVVMLALSIGATTAIFSVADDALFRPLPLPEARQLTAVYNYNQKTARYLSSSYPDYLDYRDSTQSFEQLSAYVRYPLAVSTGDRTLRVPVEAVTPEYFQMLRLAPLIGSTFTRDDAPEALLSERLWREQFGKDPAVLGSIVRIERQPFTIIGVIPERYAGANLNWSEPPEIWIPMRAIAIAVPRLAQMKIFAMRDARWLVILGRRRSDVSVEQAQAELKNLSATIASVNPANGDVTAVAFEASRSKFWPALRDRVVLSLGVFGIAAVLVLLLACANISNLMLERMLARRREFAIRTALGSGRTRLIRQMLVECLLLVTPGLIGALLISGILAKLVGRYPRAIGEIALSLDPQTDWRVLLFSVLLSIGAVALFGFAPALQVARSDPQQILKDSGMAGARVGLRFREVMVVAQIAVTTILLVGGGLFVRSLLHGYSVDPGFHSDRLIVSTFDANAVPAAGRSAFEKRLLEESAALPGIESVAISPHLPLITGRIAAQVSTPASSSHEVSLRYAGAGFFGVMGIPFVLGREFARGDLSRNVAVVSEDLAAKLWPDSMPIGRTLTLRRGTAAGTEFEIIGVARPVRAASVWEEPEPQIYLPSELVSTPFWILRTRSDPQRQLQSVREFWNRIAPDVPLWDLRTGDEIMAEALAPQRLAVRLFAAFGFVGMMLASIGVYSLTACSVARRRREIGIRIAIGAVPGALAARLFARALLLAAIGLMIGLTSAIRLGRFASPLIHHVSPSDAVTFLSIVALLLAVSGLATLLPALRAARVDPSSALRSEL